MNLIRLDMAGWKSPDDFYHAVLPALGAPDWHGRNLDALYDSLSSDINRVSPPLRIELTGMELLRSEMQEFLSRVSEVCSDAHQARGEQVQLVLLP